MAEWKAARVAFCKNNSLLLFPKPKTQEEKGELWVEVNIFKKL